MGKAIHRKLTRKKIKKFVRNCTKRLICRTAEIFACVYSNAQFTPPARHYKTIAINVFGVQIICRRQS